MRNAVLARRAILDLQDRVSSWEALYGDAAAPVTEPPTPKVAHGPAAAAEGERHGLEGDEDEDGEGWGQLDLPTDDDDAVAPPALDSATGAPHVDAPSSSPDDAAPAPPDLDLPSRPSLRTFLRQPLVTTALALAASSSLPELTLLCTLHPAALWPHRARLVDAVPEWVDPSGWVDLLPAVAPDGLEAEWEDQAPWRAEPDWCEALPSLLPSASRPPSPSPSPSSSTSTSSSPAPAPLPARRTAAALHEWYARRISRCASASLGLVDVALALVQHGAARGVPGLDETGEDLSLLAKLVYERPRAGEREVDGEGWSLERWRALSPLEVLEAYTATSDAAALPDTLRRLVLPYLSVLESRLERQGGAGSSGPTPSGGVSRPTALLHAYLASLPLSPSRPAAAGLEALAAVVAASKPTLPRARRIVQDDADLARVVLAALYGAGGRAASVEGAQACGNMFECLPAFADAQGDARGGADLFALAAAPSSSSSSAHSPPPAAPAPSALLSALRASAPRALAAHLDALDLHLSQLELLVRYAAAPPSGLAWFLAAYASRDRQAQWATRLARTAAQGGSGPGARSSAAAAGRGGAEGGGFEGEDEWVALLEFMREATGVAGEEDEGEDERRARGLGRMFCLLGDDEVLRIFFGGLLGAGRASLSLPLPSASSSKTALTLLVRAARRFLARTGPLRAVVDQGPARAARRRGARHCRVARVLRQRRGGQLARGRDEARARLVRPPFLLRPPPLLSFAPSLFRPSTSTLPKSLALMPVSAHSLSAAPQQTPALRREREFIEATSRLCSFRLDSRPGIPLTPIELRHAPDRLTYVARLLSSNDSAHKHPDMVLALVHGLGYPSGGAQEVRALAMLADAAIGAGSYPLAAEQCARAVRAVEALRRTASRLGGGEDAEGDKAKQAQADAETAADHAWRACFALGKSAWSDAPARLEALGQALTLCPPERIQDLLPTWTVLEREVAQDALRGQKDGAAAGLGASVSSRTGAGAAGGEAGAQLHGAAAVAGLSGDAARAAASAAAAGAHKVSAFLAAAAAKTAASSSSSSAAGRAPSPARPETPTSPTRAAAHSGAQGVQHLASETAAAASYTLRRAAAFLQGPQLHPVRPSSAQSNVSSSDGWHRDWDDDRGATESPASPRRATAARSPSPPPPSRFAAAFAGLADGPSSPRRAAPPPAPRSPAQAPARSAGGGGGGGFGFGLGDRLTAGVGWLIGADEMLEREKEEAEYRRKRAESQAQSQPATSEKEEQKEDKEGEDDWDNW